MANNRLSLVPWAIFESVLAVAGAMINKSAQRANSTWLFHWALSLSSLVKEECTSFLESVESVKGAVQASASLKEAASIHFNTIDHNEILRRAEWKATEVGQEWSVAQHTINAKAPNVYSAAITRSNAKIVAAKNNDNQEESGNREGSSQQTTNEQETKGRRGDEDQGEHPSNEGGSSRKRKSRKEKRTSEGKLNAMTECIHSYRGYENKMNEGSFFSIITINLRGLKGLRNGAKVANFCSQVLRYKEKYSATVICLQDLMIEEGSWTYAAI